MSKSTTTVKHEWLLEGLDCANCALKIENGVGKVKGVTSSSVNFVTKTLTIETGSEHENEVLAEAHKKVKALEPHIDIVDKAAAARLAAHEPARAHEHSHTHQHEAGIHHSHRHGAHSEDDSASSRTAASRQKRANQHGHQHSHGLNRVLLYRLIAGAALLLTGLLATMLQWLSVLVLVAAYIIVGGDIVWRAARNIARGQWFDEYFLMTIATLGAFAIKEYPEAVGVMLFYQVGEMLQGLAVNRSRKSISALLDIRPDYANLKVGHDVRKVSPEDVQIGNVIVVKPGERVPLDGKIVEGSSYVDTSALTGESMPREVTAGSEVLSGFINTSGLLTVEVTKSYGESTVSKILDMVQNASSKKAPTENFITKFARYYTPVVVIVAVALAVLPPLLFPAEQFADWLYRALIFLVISCPCALVVSIPLGFFGGIGAASKNGILIKGSNYLEALNDVKYAVFDKTGTLTKGSFQVTKVHSTGRYTEQQLLEYAAYAEQHSTHPIAASIIAAYGQPLSDQQLEHYEEISGHGVSIRWQGRSILVGNARLMERETIPYAAPDHAGTLVYIAVDGKYAGHLVIADEVKQDAAAAIASLKQLGVKKTVMLTGDVKAVGEAVGKQLGVDEVHAELLPQHKVEHIERLAAAKGPKEKLAFIGDGINDTPVLAQADVGIAMGGLGSDAAIEAADIVIMTDEPSKLATAISIARSTRRIVWQNIIFALGVKAIFLALGAFGIATMWEAVFSDVGVTLLAVLNAMRVLRLK